MTYARLAVESLEVRNNPSGGAGQIWPEAIVTDVSTEREIFGFLPEIYDLHNLYQAGRPMVILYEADDLFNDGLPAWNHRAPEDAGLQPPFDFMVVFGAEHRAAIQELHGDPAWVVPQRIFTAPNTLDGSTDYFVLPYASPRPLSAGSADFLMDWVDWLPAQQLTSSVDPLPAGYPSMSSIDWKNADSKDDKALLIDQTAPLRKVDVPLPTAPSIEEKPLELPVVWESSVVQTEPYFDPFAPYRIS